MYKKLLLFVFVTAILTLTQFATADYRITNGSATEAAWIAYSAWTPANGGWRTGWRTQGWDYVAPGTTHDLSIPQNSKWVYIRVEQTDSTEIKPPDHATRDKYPFWIHPLEDFTVVMSSKGEILESNLDEKSLDRADYYKYENHDSHTILDDPDQNLPDLPAQQIYNQAMSSVVWIETFDNNDNYLGKGSGVLIDKERKLVVTNAHVIRGARDIYVFFPWRDQKGLNKNEDFYLDNWAMLERRGYATEGRVIAQHVRNDLAIVQLDRLSPAAREIKRDFSRNVEDSMKKGDTVHILGNPGNRLWNWTRGAFQKPFQVCRFADGTSVVGCLEMEADTHGGNSGGPVLNGQGTLIGILVGGTDETVSLAAPARNVKALLNTIPANLGAIPPPQQTYPKRVFRIRNNTGVLVSYQVKWSNNNDWKRHSIENGFIVTHWSGGQNIPSGYPKIRFDHIAGDGQQVTYRTYKLETALFRQGNNNHAPTYRFEFNRWGDRLDLYRDNAAAPTLSKPAPKETDLLTNYPNPCNPETWIPYQLSKPAEVTVTIYAADGKLVRTLALGHQPAGVYQSKSRAAYWDGKNEVGEPVASGVYFYTLKAGDFTATRKMLIRK